MGSHNNFILKRASSFSAYQSRKSCGISGLQWNHHPVGSRRKVVHVNRVSKVVKGGRRFGTAALVVVGNGKGKVGYGTGKAKEVPEAVRKATENAKNKMIRVHLKENRTLYYDTVGRFGAGKVILRSAVPGTGIIAGGPMRALFESLGIKDIVAKSIGSSNPHNMIKATFDAFKRSESPKQIASKRSKKINEIIKL